MAVALDEKDLTEVESQKSEALKDVDKTYNGMIGDYTAKTDELINESKNWVDTQTKLQEENYGLEIKEIENQKADARKDYLKEQSGAYYDWQKQSNKYGAEAERMASMGVANSGYSESSQVAMYTAYQNRVAAAREAFVRSDTAFNLLMDKAKLQNDTLLAEIAINGLREQLSLAIESMQYTNSLLIQKSAEKRAINSDYYNRWIGMYSQIKQQEQFEANLAFQKEQFAWQKAQAAKSSSVSSSGSSSNKSSGSSSNKSSSNSVSKNTSSSTSSKSSSKDDLTVDMASVLALGYGPINAARLNSLVKIGEVQEIVDPIKGVITYKKTNPSLVVKSKYK